MLVSAGNAMVRYAFNISSNAWLELQWYFFSAVFLLAAGYTLRRNEHVRIDVIDGTPVAAHAGLDRPPRRLVLAAADGDHHHGAVLAVARRIRIERNEFSGDPGGLLRWPVRLLIPAGFLLLGLQGVSEIIKRVAFLLGPIPDPAERTGDAACRRVQGTAA